MIGDENVIDEIGPDESRLASAILVILCVILVTSTLLYGAVDPGTFSILAIFTALIIILWAADSWGQKAIRFSGSWLLLPVIGLIFLGLIQILPLRGSDIPPELLKVPVAGTLSLDPYST